MSINFRFRITWVNVIYLFVSNTLEKFLLLLSKLSQNNSYYIWQTKWFRIWGKNKIDLKLFLMKRNRSGNGFDKPINKGLKQGLKLILFAHMIICFPRFSNHWFLHFLIYKILVCPPIYLISKSLNLYLNK